MSAWPFHVTTWALCLAASGCVLCDNANEDARALVAEFGRCEAKDACQFVGTSDLGVTHCLGFQCGVVLRADANLADFRRRFRALGDDYSGCHDCPIAGCINPSQMEAFCNPATALCDLRAKTR